jgi:hypothetical protein
MHDIDDPTFKKPIVRKINVTCPVCKKPVMVQSPNKKTIAGYLYHKICPSKGGKSG